MKKSGWIPGVAVLVAAQIGSIAVGCGETPPVDGTGGSGGSTGGAGGSGGATGGAGIGGMGGEVCESDVGLGGTCGRCEVSVADYCADHDCEMPAEQASCFSGTLYIVTSTGCGFHRVEHRNGNIDPVPLELDVWDIDSGELVHHFSRSKEADACLPDVIVGEEPECSSYVEVCDTSFPCPLPPHWECFGPCYRGCVAGSLTCEEAEATCLAGQGGEGGLGGGPP